MYTVKAELAGTWRSYTCASLADTEALQGLFAKHDIPTDFAYSPPSDISKLAGQALADAFAVLKTLEKGGPVWATHTGRVIEFGGHNLPYHPQHPHKSGHGWTMGDEVRPDEARHYIANRGCVGQYVAYDPHHKEPQA